MGIPTLQHTQLVGLEHATDKSGAMKVKAKTKQLQPVTKDDVQEFDLVIGADGPQSEVTKLLDQTSHYL